MPLSLKSSVFQNGQEIPRRYTGEGENVSPPLQWSNVPEGTREFAIVCVDPDAPGREPWVHWVLFNISPSTTLLPEGLPAKPSIDVPVRAQQGINGAGELGYYGPMPPKGHGRHRYFFKLYALDTELAVRPGCTKADLVNAIQGHIIETASLIGTYQRGAARKAA